MTFIGFRRFLIFRSNLASMEAECDDPVSKAWSSIVDSFAAAEAILPELEMAPRRPWITQATVTLIHDRALACERGDYESEKQMRMAVRRAAKVDKAAWLDTVVADSSWKNIRRVREQKLAKQGRWRDDLGENQQ